MATRFRYNLDGQLEQVLRSDHATIDFAYDHGGRLTRISTPGGQIDYAYEAITGLLSRVVAGGNAIAFTYDGNIPLSLEWTGEVKGRVDVEFDDNLWMAQQRINGHHPVEFRRNKDGMLTGVGALNFVRSAENGLLTGSTLGIVEQRVDYDGYGEMIADTVGYGGTLLFARRYMRDRIGRIAEIRETIAGEPERSYAFAYDTVGRLVEVRRDGAAAESYLYDANGNRIRSVLSTGVLNGVVDSQDRLVSYGETAFVYSDDGELQLKVIGSDTTAYEYDAFGNLREVRLSAGTVVEYLVDPQNRRIGKKVDGVLIQAFLYQDQLNAVAELDAAGNVVSRFVYGQRINVPEYMVKGGKTYRLVADHLGSVRMVVDAATGAVAQRIDYDAWGNITFNSSPGFQPFGFAGGLVDAHTGLTRFGVRDYDASTGRWTSKDPILFAGRSSNLYAYALEDPVNNIDPDGKQALAGTLKLAGGLAVADGPLPVGDVIAGTLLLGMGAYALYDLLRNESADSADGEYCPVPLPEGELGPDNLPPDPDWEWRGPRDKGSAHNPKTGESLRPDLQHGPPHGPHYDYKDPTGQWWRVDPNTGGMSPK